MTKKLRFVGFHKSVSNDHGAGSSVSVHNTTENGNSHGNNLRFWRRSGPPDNFAMQKRHTPNQISKISQIGAMRQLNDLSQQEY